MAENSKCLSDDDLWAKCQQDSPITSKDLGISPSKNSSDGTTYITEGINYLQFELINKCKSQY